MHVNGRCRWQRPFRSRANVECRSSSDEASRGPSGNWFVIVTTSFPMLEWLSPAA